MKRGFKARCDRMVDEVRAGLGLSKFDAFDPFVYAESINVRYVPVSSLATCPEWAREHVAGPGRKDFSAVTVYSDDGRALIVYNDSNSSARQVSDVAHELAHIILKHRPRPFLGDGGCRVWDKEQAEQEEEAVWLSGVLLVPGDAALAIVREGSDKADIAEVAADYGVSTKMLKYRLNVSGAYIKLRRGSRGA